MSQTEDIAATPPCPDMELISTSGARYLLHRGRDMINQQLMSGHAWEPFTQLVARLFLGDTPNPVVVDVGANLGAFAVPLALHIQARGGHLIAFEAQRMVYYQLCANLLLNGLENAQVHHLAIGDRDGQIAVPVLDYGQESNIGSLSLDPGIRHMQGSLSTLSNRSEQVALRRLDALGLPPASLVKIDVEGMELEVLRGARDWLIASGYPPLLFEVWGDHMEAYRDKKALLMAFVSETLGYDIDMIGELAVAQHPTRAMFRIEGTGKSIRFHPLA